MILSKLSMLWLSSREKSLQITSYNLYETLLTVYIFPKLGNMSSKKVKERDLKNLIDELLQSGNKKTKKGLSSSTLIKIIQILKMVLNYGVKIGAIKYNPAYNLEPIRLKKK